jgi:hypothetical protein
MKRKVGYINKGRYGYVVYKDAHSELSLSFEFGGRNCVAIIFVPTVDEWEKTTKRPLADREPILKFIAEQAIKDQAPNCTYVLSDNSIDLMSPEKATQ